MEPAPDVYRRLQEYDWPGNVRELQNVIARALINLGRDEALITERHLVIPFAESLRPVPAQPGAGDSGASLKVRQEAWERELLRQILEECGGNKTAAARRLGISIRTLYNKLERYCLR